MNAELLRSALYVPAANPRAMAKAASLAADVVILDLEDSVAPDAKADSRGALAGACGPRTVVRINGAGTSWHAEDIDAAVAAGPRALLLAKVSTAEDAWAFRREIMMRRPREPVAAWAMIETPMGVLNAAAIAAALGPGGVVVLGLNDLAKDTGMAQEPGRAPMLGVLTTVVLAARAHGLGVLDGVFNDLADADGFKAECRQARAFGFDGKTLIHPSQIGPANAAFAPSESEMREARAIVDAFADPQNAGRGVIALCGRMVERLHLAMAEAVLAKVELAKASAAAADRA